MSNGLYTNRDYYRLAKKNSYGGSVSLSDKRYIVIHNTGNNGDTAKNNMDYFATGNTRSAGAQIFIDQNGKVAQSMPINYIAYSVGDKSNGRGTMFGTITNTNSISIELCDIVSKDCSSAMIKATADVIAWIKTQCPNIKGIYRHYDVTTKSCPQRYISSAKWKSLLAQLEDGHIIEYEADFSKEWIVRLQKHYGTTADGIISGQKKTLAKYFPAVDNNCITWTGKGSELVRAIQKKYNCDADGLLGEQTIKAWQKQLFGEGSKEIDGIWGKKTSDAIKKWI